MPLSKVFLKNADKINKEDVCKKEMKLIETQNSNLKSQNHNSKVKTDLKHRCYCFSIRIIKFLQDLGEDSIYRIISNQLLRSATSIGANIIEAKSASSKRDFIRFYEIALNSANETKYWLGLLRDAMSLGKEQNEEVKSLLEETDEVSKILGKSLLTMKKEKVLRL